MERKHQIVGYNSRGDRQRDDYYATPAATTRALLSVESFDGDIWEPACGEGHISKELKRAGYNVESTDLIDRGFGTVRVDFLLEHRRCDNIVTNPPYRNALDFVAHATFLAERKVAMLLKLNFLEGVERATFFENKPPARVWVFKRRQALMKNGVASGAGMMTFAWFVWEAGHDGAPVVGWIG